MQRFKSVSFPAVVAIGRTTQLLIIADQAQCACSVSSLACNLRAALAVTRSSSGNRTDRSRSHIGVDSGFRRLPAEFRTPRTEFRIGSIPVLDDEQRNFEFLGQDFRIDRKWFRVGTNPGFGRRAMRFRIGTPVRHL